TSNRRPRSAGKDLRREESKALEVLHHVEQARIPAQPSPTQPCRAWSSLSRRAQGCPGNLRHSRNTADCGSFWHGRGFVDRAEVAALEEASRKAQGRDLDAA